MGGGYCSVHGERNKSNDELTRGPKQAIYGRPGGEQDRYSRISSAGHGDRGLQGRARWFSRASLAASVTVVIPSRAAAVSVVRFSCHRAQIEPKPLPRAVHILSTNNQ